MRKIPLTQNKFALVDEGDFSWLNQWKWFYLNGYAARNEKTETGHRTVYMHREIANPLNGMQVDHRNQNKLDNQRRNLRLATSRENTINTGKRSHNTSGYKGVTWNKASGSWVVRVQDKGKKLYFGSFKDPKEAAIMYNTVVRKLHGDFAVLNEVS